MGINTSTAIGSPSRRAGVNRHSRTNCTPLVDPDSKQDLSAAPLLACQLRIIGRDAIQNGGLRVHGPPVHRDHSLRHVSLGSWLHRRRWRGSRAGGEPDTKPHQKSENRLPQDRSAGTGSASRGDAWKLRFTTRKLWKSHDPLQLRCASLLSSPSAEQGLRQRTRCHTETLYRQPPPPRQDDSATMTPCRGVGPRAEGRHRRRAHTENLLTNKTSRLIIPDSSSER
jgi:hypothetical protein